MSHTDIRDLLGASEDHLGWGTLHQHNQSQYSEGLCERCPDPIAPGERHETRHWLGGLAESCQHIVCPRDRDHVHEACTETHHIGKGTNHRWLDPHCVECGQPL